MILTSFHGLLRLGDLAFNNPNLQNWRKVTKRSSLNILPLQYNFLLPTHKADKFFEGNKVVI